MRDTAILAGQRPSVSGIEGLRAVAALGVVGAHFIVSVEAQWGAESIHPLVDAALRLGVQGVNLFFVLSGFLLALPFLDAIANGARLPSMRRNELRRSQHTRSDRCRPQPKRHFDEMGPRIR